MARTNNPSIHYLGIVGAVTPNAPHSACEAWWERIKAERPEYGKNGAYNFGICNTHGIRMVGRGWDQDSAANGTDGNGDNWNQGSRAACLLVGTDDVLSQPLLFEMELFYTEAVMFHGMEGPLRPHSSYVATFCPGDPARAAIDQINAGLPVGDDMTPDQARQLDEVHQALLKGFWGVPGVYKMVQDLHAVVNTGYDFMGARVGPLFERIKALFPA